MPAVPSRNSAARAAATKSRIISGLLMPGAVSTPDDTSTPGASAARMARADILGIETAGQQPGARKHPSTEQLPVERGAVPAWARRTLLAPLHRTAACRRFSRMQKRQQDPLLCDRDRFDDRHAETLLHGSNALRRFAAMQLDEIRLDAPITASSMSSSPASPSSTTSRLRPRMRAASEDACSGVRSRGEAGMKNEPGKIRARAHRRIGRVGAGDPADFDLDAHGPPLIATGRTESKQRLGDVPNALFLQRFFEMQGVGDGLRGCGGVGCLR